MKSSSHPLARRRCDVHGPGGLLGIEWLEVANPVDDDVGESVADATVLLVIVTLTTAARPVSASFSRCHH